MKTGFLKVLFLSALFATLANTDQIIRIAVGHEKGVVHISGPDLEAVTGDGKAIKNSGSIKLSPGRSAVMQGSSSTESQLVRIKSPGLITVQNRKFRGNLEVIWQHTGGTQELLLVHLLPIETYVAGIVASETPKGWGLEALKAQAITSRTYAVWQKYRRLTGDYHMESTTIDQVYRGIDAEHSLAVKATEDTNGQVLTYAGRPIQAYFHAACGGHTESAEDIWGTALPYLPGAKCGFCKGSRSYKWEYRINRLSLNSALKSVSPGSVKAIRAGQKTEGGRLKTVEILGKKGKKVISGDMLRKLLGYNNLRSTLITDISIGPLFATFSGRGHGHGVGLCQWGAYGMANAGYSAKDILEHYFPGTEIRKMY